MNTVIPPFPIPPVSLFNMYPEGTFGKSPFKNDSAQSFVHTYRRRFQRRNALTCFVSGATWCVCPLVFLPVVVLELALPPFV